MSPELHERIYLKRYLPAQTWKASTDSSARNLKKLNLWNWFFKSRSETRFQLKFSYCNLPPDILKQSRNFMPTINRVLKGWSFLWHCYRFNNLHSSYAYSNCKKTESFESKFIHFLYSLEMKAKVYTIYYTISWNGWQNSG